MVNHPPQMYLAYRISIADILVMMRDELPYGKDIDISVIAMEMLHNIFFDRVNNFGKWQGVLGAYQVQIPNILTPAEVMEIDVLMHDYIGQLADVLSATFPSMVAFPRDHYFFYPSGETDLTIYVPIKEDLPPHLASKAIPENAIRSALR